MHIDKDSRTKMKPYLNMDEMVQDFEKLFPSRKEELVIIVAEVDNMIAFALYLWLEKSTNIGHIYDLLINRNLYS